MYCNACGKQMVETAKFCDACGKAVAGSAAGNTAGANAGPTAGPAGSGNTNATDSNPYRGRLIRPIQGRKFKGVCLAVANYLDVDVVVVRIVWLVAFFMYGCGVMAYLIGWLAIDGEEEYVQV